MWRRHEAGSEPTPVSSGSPTKKVQTPEDLPQPSRTVWPEPQALRDSGGSGETADRQHAAGGVIGEHLHTRQSCGKFRSIPVGYAIRLHPRMHSRVDL